MGKKESLSARVHGYFYVHFYKEVRPHRAVQCPQEVAPHSHGLQKGSTGLLRAPCFTPSGCVAHPWMQLLRPDLWLKSGPISNTLWVLRQNACEGKVSILRKSLSHLPCAEISAPSNLPHTPFPGNNS